LLVSELVIILVIFSFRWLLHWFWQFFSLAAFLKQAMISQQRGAKPAKLIDGICMVVAMSSNKQLH